MKLNLQEYSMEHKDKVKVRGRFINRELSWIDFNARVLSCAMDEKTPLNERFNFLGITGSNMDEFISVRFANAFNDRENEPYEKILKMIKTFMSSRDRVFDKLEKELNKKGLEFTTMSKLTRSEREKVYRMYMNNIFPLLTPISIGAINAVPNLVSGQLSVAAIIKQGGVEDLNIIPIVNGIDSTCQIGNKVIFVEDIIMYYMKETLFINKEIVTSGAFRVIKDASVILSHDTSKFIIDRMNETLKKRNESNPLFLEVDRKCPEYLEDRLMSMLGIPAGHKYDKSRVINFKRFMQDLLDSTHSFNKFEPFLFEDHASSYYSLFEALKERDILLHHPYDSYETIVKFIQHAASDPSVEAIKQTLYRVSSIDSPIVNALCKAARNGKAVTVLIEIKARFDEENNINLIEKLKSAGAKVVLGIEYLKTHCKLCIVIRKEKNRLKIYSHVGTGNYNENTSKIYTDLSYLTSKQKIGFDLLHVFNILSGHSSPDEKLDKIFYAPVTLRKKLVKCIDREIHYAKNGKKAEIIMKLNSLSDRMMVDKLYEAGLAGVQVTIICRGVCSIVPTKNIRIKSIVGRFLEHSRIYYFKNGKSPEYFISSADLLTRNLDKRVETLISLKDSNVIKQLKWMLEVMVNDRRNSFAMTEKGTWERMKGDFDSHQWFIEYSDIKKTKKKWRK